MHDPARTDLGQLVVTPLATIGVLAAILVWEIEHVGSLVLALCIAAIATTVGALVARRLRRGMDGLATHYETLLHNADEQSRRAEEANSVKDDFLSALSHELRTPLNSILGWTRLLATGKLEPPQTARALRAIEHAGWAQSRLIEDLLDISRIVAGKLQIAPRSTAIQPLIESALESMRPAAEAKHIAIETSLDPALPSICIDPDRLRQVVWNLASNAIKFTPDGGRVEVRLRIDGSHMVLSVLDTGIGFNPQVAANLFQRFRQGDSSSTRQYGGLGLGLGIVRHVVELHGGTVTATSAGKGHGSVFEVRLPIRAAASAPAIDIPPPAAEAPSRRDTMKPHQCTVLVVEDDAEARELLRLTLSAKGYKVATVANGREALHHLRSHDQTCIILLDLMLPVMDGVHFRAAQLRDRSLAWIPLVVMSGAVDATRHARELGARHFVQKPLDLDRVLQVLRNVRCRQAPLPRIAHAVMSPAGR